ncbi:MAG: hypothetical protein CMI09_10980 [Oceanospirillaceae bacterium]|nr:hypothetical protein [Oceanospirillaceae bacterium]
MRVSDSFDQYKDFIGVHKTSELDVVGIGIAGEKDKVASLTKQFSMYS